MDVLPNHSGPSQIQPNKLPYLGVGLGLRREIAQETLVSRDKIDWLEIVPENYMGRGGAHLETLRYALDQGFPIVSHGVNLSIGSADPLNETYLEQLKALFRIIQPPWFSDHLCFTSVGNTYLNDLLPLPTTWEAVHHIVKRIKAVQARFDIPFLIENISYYLDLKTAELTEAQFLSEVLERADCGLMLDVNNVYVNSQNHGFDPIAFLDQIPLERTVQIHIAGHHRLERLIVDTHGATICPDVYTLLEEVLTRIPVNGILLERDTFIPQFEEILVELQQLREIVARVEAKKQSQVTPA